MALLPRLLSLSTFPPLPVDIRVRGVARMVARPYITGDGRVHGTVKVFGTPSFPKFARVRLIRENDATCVAEQWSDPTTGVYSFDGFERNLKYTVLAYDPAQNLRAVVADNLTPEPM